MKYFLVHFKLCSKYQVVYVQIHCINLFVGSSNVVYQVSSQPVTHSVWVPVLSGLLQFQSSCLLVAQKGQREWCQCLGLASYVGDPGFRSQHWPGLALALTVTWGENYWMEDYSFIFSLPFCVTLDFTLINEVFFLKKLIFLDCNLQFMQAL